MSIATETISCNSSYVLIKHHLRQARNGCSTSSDFHEISIPWIIGDGHKLQNGHRLCNKGKLSRISLIQGADKKTEIPGCPHFCDTV